MVEQSYYCNQVERILCRYDTTLFCRSGEFWVTVDGVMEDYILRTGMSLQLYAGQMCVVQACTAGLLTCNFLQQAQVEDARRVNWPQKYTAYLAQLRNLFGF